MRLLIDAIALRHDLHVAGRIEDERRLLLGAIARDQPAALTARHRYYLALLAIEEERLEEARKHLDDLDERIGASIKLPESGYWRDHFLGERHNLEMGRANLYRAAGLLGRASVHRARADEAFHAYETCRLAAGREVPAPRKAIRWLFDLDFELARMRYAEAVQLADDALGTSELSAANRFQVVRRRAAALAQLALDDDSNVDTAREALEDIALQPDDSGVASAEDRFDACFRLVRLHALAGRRSEAQRWTKEAVRLSTLGESTSRMRSSELLVSMELDAWMADPGAPFESTLDASWDAAMQSRLRWWREKPPRPGGTGTLHFDRVDYVLEVGMRSALRRGTEGHAAAVARLSDALSTSDLFKRLRLPRRSLEDQLSCLLPGEVALFLFSSAAGGHGFIATRDMEVHAFRTGTSRSLRSAANRYSLLVTTAPTGDPESRRRELESAQEELTEELGLLAPDAEGTTGLGRLFAAEAVVVVASELTFDPPIEALVQDGRSLGAQAIVSHVPCLDYLAALRDDEGRSAVSTVRVVADVPYAGWNDPRQRALPRVDVGEARASRWASSIGGAGAVQLGEEGTVEALIGASSEREEALIVFAHGDLVDNLERSSAVVLGAANPALDGAAGSDAAEGRLTASTIESMPGWDVVFLAACGAGSGQAVQGGGGGGHLGDAFLVTGSRAVLLSRGDLPAEATALILDRWTEAVGEGASVGEALRRARSAIEGSTRMADPYYHSGVRLFGHQGATLRKQKHTPTSGRRVLLWTLPVLGAVLLLLMVRQRSARTRS